MKSRITLTRDSGEEVYEDHLEETKLIARKQIFANDGEVPEDIVEQVNILTESQYNAIVKGIDELEPNPEIPQLQVE